MFSPNSVCGSVNLYVLLFCPLFLSTCTGSLFSTFSIPYTVNKPEKIYTLKKALNEVSGLNIVSENEAALIDDERGTIFYYNLKSQQITSEVNFSKGGDWEDLLMKGDTAYVLKSDGTIIEIDTRRTPLNQVIVTTHDTELSKENDTEGICYDPVNKIILIACKGKPALVGSAEQYKGKRAIYSFNTVTKKLNTTPVYLVDIHKVESILVGMQMNAVRRIMQLYNINTKVAFQPSGLAIHPFTKDIYIISAVGNILLILNPEGKILGAVKLSPKLYKQPEGITFDPSGNMFISNEGKSGKGNILKFSYKQNTI